MENFKLDNMVNDLDQTGWINASPKPKKTARSNSIQNQLNHKSEEQTNLNSKIEYNKTHINLIKNYINNKIKVLVILRGCSGSGKSTLASQLKFNGTVISADSYFVNLNGFYCFDKNKLSDAHLNCRLKANEAMKKDLSPILIDNTNIKIWEFKPYIKLAVKNNYKIEIIEPETPWKNKANILFEKNVHSVPLSKIKQSLSDYEKKIDLSKLILECQSELDKEEANKKPKPSGIFGTLANDFNNSDWSLNITKSEPNEPLSLSSLAIKQPINLIKEKETKIEKVNFYLNDSFNEKTSLEHDETEQESVNILKSMFPDIKEDIIKEFLFKYNNDVNIVTNILLDSINFSSDDQQQQQQHQQNKKESNEMNEKNLEKKNNYLVKSLQELCLIEMDKLESKMEELNNKIKLIRSSSLLKKFSNKDNEDNNNNNNMALSCNTESSPSKFQCQSCFRKQDEEPIMSIKMNKLKQIIELFGTDDELDQLENNSSEIPIDFDMAYQLYLSWKNGLNKQSVESQIENDKKISLELFEEINIRDPIDKVPVYLSEKGFNSAELSLRQIMAEEMAAEKDKKTSNKNKYSIQNDQTSSFHFKTISNNLIRSMPGHNQSEYIANKIKLKHLYEMYENLVDKRTIEETFQQKNFNLNDTTQFLNSFFGYNSNDLKEPNKIHDIKNTKLNKRMLSNNNKENNENTNLEYYNNDVSDNYDSEFVYDNSRDLAKKYLNMRQGYFEKAAEAYNRGWGAVAQYYADMGHEQTKKINISNDLASLQIFNYFNPDIKNSNTLDLHGLHVKEAITVLKNILYQKKSEFYNLIGKKQKTYLFVITGYGHHSENGPRLRPNVISFLNQNGIKFKELNVGLLQVFLINN